GEVDMVGAPGASPAPTSALQQTCKKIGNSRCQTVDSVQSSTLLRQLSDTSYPDLTDTCARRERFLSSPLQSVNLPPVLSRLMYSPFLVQLVVTRRCNLSCTYCNEFDEVSDPVPTDELKRRIDKIRELGAWALELTGGEPMMHPEIYELVRYAKSLGFM